MAIQVAADTCYAELTHARLKMGRFTVAGWWRIDDLSLSRPLWSIGGSAADVVWADNANYLANQLRLATKLNTGTVYSANEGTVIPQSGQWFYLTQVIDITPSTNALPTRQFYNGKPDPTSNAGGTTTALALQTTPVLRVFGAYEGIWARAAGAMVRVFVGNLTAKDIEINMISRRAPTHLRSRCLVDAPFSGDLINRGLLGGAFTTTGTVTFASSPTVGRRAANPARFVRSTVTLIPGSQAPETDTGAVGTPAIRIPGQQPSETDTGSTGTPALRLLGAQPTETDTGAHGTPNVFVAGAQAVEISTASAGTPRVLLAGGLASETDTGATGRPAVTLAGVRAIETDSGASGTPTVTTAGQQALEADTGTPGAPNAVLTGAQPTETDAAATGAAYLTYPGARGDELDSANGGSVAIAWPGLPALEVWIANPGNVFVAIPTPLFPPITTTAVDNRLTTCGGNELVTAAIDNRLTTQE